MADTKQPIDERSHDVVQSLDSQTRMWLDQMLPLLDRAENPHTGAPPHNSSHDLHFQDISRYPQVALAGPAPPADVDPLTAAIKAKDAYRVQQYVTLLIVSGYHLGGPDSNGDIPLILAAQSNDFIITTMVLGPSPNPRNSAGETPLIIAAQLGNAQSVEFLLKKKADASIRDKAQKTALDYALQNQKASPSNKDLLQVLTLLQDAEKKLRPKIKP
jgi:ankyrin repeat protein